MQTDQLTREQVLAMSAGRELDALVQERVFGNPILGLVDVWCEGPTEYTVMGKPTKDYARPCYLGNCLCYLRDEFDETIYGHITSCLRVVLPYSTDIAAAWEVVKHLTQWWGEGENASRLEFTLYLNARDRWVCVFDDFADVTDGDHETAPLAICRAALLATL